MLTPATTSPSRPLREQATVGAGGAPGPLVSAGALAAVLALLVAVALAARRTRPRLEDVRWRSGGAALEGTLYVPPGHGPHPAAAFVPGYGDWTRDERLFRVHAERLAARGLAMLIYDKRGCGASSGDWRLATLDDLAGDALGAHALLRADPRMRADAVGLFGTSQGANVAVIAAAREPAVAFVATLSLTTFSPAEHAIHLAGERVRRAGHGEDAARAAEELERRIQDAYRTGAGFDEARAALAAAAGAPWAADARLELLAASSPRARALRDLPLDHDPLAALARVAVPVLAAQGGRDDVVPVERTVRELAALRDAHDRDLAIVVVPEAGHTLRVRAGIGPLGRWTWPTAYWDALDAWRAGVVAP